MVKDSLVFDAHGRHAQAVTFTADSQLLVSTGMDAAIRLWRAPKFEPVGVFTGHQKCVNSAALSRDGTRLATCSTDGTARIWSFPDGALLHTLPGQRLPRWSRDGRLLTTASTAGRIVHWDAVTYEKLGQLSALDRRLICFEFAPDDAQLLVGGTGAIQRVRLHDGNVLGTLSGHGVAVTALALSPSGALLASTGAEGTLRLWETAGWQAIREVPLHVGGILQVAWAPSGHQLAVAGDHVVQVIPVREGEPPVRIEVPIKGVYGLAWSPDGRWLANAGADGKLRIWDVSA